MKHSAASLENIDGKPYRIGIVAARYNAEMMDELLKNTIATLTTSGVLPENIQVFRVPGALELPLMAQKMADAKTFDVLIALGIVIRGDTAHFDYVCSESYRGLMEVSLSRSIPVVFGILTTETIEQALERVKSERLNKGGEFARTALEMAMSNKEQLAMDN